MEQYDHKKIEKKWQEKWDREKIFEVKEKKDKKTFYCLIEFPYASGEGLHVGHVRSYTALDIVARKKRMEGLNVLYPIGWDAFGLPTENYAIKTGLNPRIITKNNTDNFRRQLKSLGFSFDWSREINTSSPEYYKWTQWIFLKFFEEGLAYKKKMGINWCVNCKTGLANEEVVNGECERCGGRIEIREKEQWMLAITKYAERLYNDLDETDFLEKIKIQQKNWIGRSEGAEIEFPIKFAPQGLTSSVVRQLADSSSRKDLSLQIKVFTTRPDTLFGATYLVIAPENDLVKEMLKNKEIENKKEVEDYILETQKKKEIERLAEGKEKTGIELKGIKAINPANKEEIPVFIADYVLASYGTGAIMAVPAHDERDNEFAKKFNLKILPVIIPEGNVDIKIYSEFLVQKNETNLFTQKHIDKHGAYINHGILINSGKFNEMNSKKAMAEITESVGGEIKTIYGLRDWVFSRQRYWGEPIPLIHCEKCGWVPVPESQLPVILPDVENYQPTDTGESPLAKIEEWVNTTCPKCKGQAKRETDTMPNWAGSSWYWLRYTDTQNNKEFASKDKLKYWTPVDLYNGGMEHTTLHLLYSRFWHKFLFDQGLVPTKEPYKKRVSHGMVLGEGGEKMSKTKGNVVNPDDMVERFGADTLRLYEMFIGPFDQPVGWSSDSMVGLRRFIERVWKMKELIHLEASLPSGSEASKSIETTEILLNQTIKKVGEDIEKMKFNTAVSALMIFTNEVLKENQITKTQFEKFLKILSPFVPHLSEEIWNQIGNIGSICLEKWPEYNRDKIEIISERVKIAVQINGKIRGEINVPKNIKEEEIKKIILETDFSKKWISDKKVKKMVYVKDKLVSIVL